MTGPLILYRGADKSSARSIPSCILFDGENISFDASLVIYINSTNIPTYHLHVPIVKISGGLNLLEPCGPVLACNGTALPLPLLIFLQL